MYNGVKTIDCIYNTYRYKIHCATYNDIVIFYFLNPCTLALQGLKTYKCEEIPYELRDCYCSYDFRSKL